MDKEHKHHSVNKGHKHTQADHKEPAEETVHEHPRQTHVVKKKSNKVWLTAAVIILIPIIVLGYLGFVPIVSDILGANRPKDLGVKTTTQDYVDASMKLGRARETLPAGGIPEESLKFSGSHPVDTSFTQEQVTATMQSRRYKYNPIGDDFQARFNDDGTVEMSGTLKIGNFRGYGKATGVSEDQIDEIMGKASLIKVNPAFYVKGTGSVQNNRLSYDVKEVKLGRINLPADAFEGNYISNFVQDRIENIPGLYVESLSIQDGALKFKGTYPDKTYYDMGK